MKIKILKEGRYCLHPSEGPIVQLFKDSVKEYSADICKNLVKDGWAEHFELEDVEDVEEDVDNDPDGHGGPEDAEDDGLEDSKDDGSEDEDEYWTKESAEKKLKELCVEATSEADQKQVIQDWGMVEFDHKVSKKKTVDNMIAELVENITEEDE